MSGQYLVLYKYCNRENIFSESSLRFGNVTTLLLCRETVIEYSYFEHSDVAIAQKVIIIGWIGYALPLSIVIAPHLIDKFVEKSPSVFFGTIQLCFRYGSSYMGLFTNLIVDRY